MQGVNLTQNNGRCVGSPGLVVLWAGRQVPLCHAQCEVLYVAQFDPMSLAHSKHFTDPL